MSDDTRMPQRVDGAMDPMEMGKPERLEETFDTPAAAAHRLAALANEQRLVGSAMIQTAPGSAAIEDAFPPRAMRGMLWGALGGVVAGVLLGVWFEAATFFTGSWGGLLSGGAPALAGMVGAFLALGGVIGGLVGFYARDTHAGAVRAKLTAMVKPNGSPPDVSLPPDPETAKNEHYAG